MHPDGVGSARPWRLADNMKFTQLQKLNSANDQWQQEEQKGGLSGMTVLEFPDGGPQG